MFSIKRILIVTGDFVCTGGMDKGNFYLADYFARLGLEVHLVAHRVDPLLLAYPNVVFHRATFPLKSYLLGEWFLSQLGEKTARKLGDETVTIVNGGNCSLPGLNWVHYVHAVASPPVGRTVLRRIKGMVTHRLALHREKKALHRARTVIANSERTKQDLITPLGIPEHKIKVIYYGSDSSAFNPATPEEKTRLRVQLGFPREKTLFTFIGALSDGRKGFDTLFAAWLLLAGEIRQSSELLVIGAGTEISAWEAKSQQAGVGDSIRFLGFRRDVPDILRAVDALVSPTRYDSFGLAVLEALCAGLPAIVSRNAGVAERYPGNLSELLLSDPKNSSELAAKLTLVFQHRDRLMKTVEETAASLITYSWEKMGDGFVAAIQSGYPFPVEKFNDNSPPPVG